MSGIHAEEKVRHEGRKGRLEKLWKKSISEEKNGQKLPLADPNSGGELIERSFGELHQSNERGGSQGLCARENVSQRVQLSRERGGGPLQQTSRYFSGFGRKREKKKRR